MSQRIICTLFLSLAFLFVPPVMSGNHTPLSLALVFDEFGEFTALSCARDLHYAVIFRNSEAMYASNEVDAMARVRK